MNIYQHNIKMNHENVTRM